MQRCFQPHGKSLEFPEKNCFLRVKSGLIMFQTMKNIVLSSQIFFILYGMKDLIAT